MHARPPYPPPTRTSPPRHRRHVTAPPPQVLGNAKGVVAVIISVLYFRNPVNFYSVFGYLITVSGVVLYSQAKKAARRTAQLQKLASGLDGVRRLYQAS